MAVEKYDFKKIEENILDFWENSRTYQKVKEKNKGKKKFYFLQGPPYTSGNIHIGHAWNNSLKDVALRYKRMQGLDVWDRGGYDMHGLPTENKVQKELKLKTKKDIVRYGLDKFAKECIKYSTEGALKMNKDFVKLGIWLDHENAYWPIRNSYIEGEWWFIKKAAEHKRLYKGKKVMTWCKHCETALAKHELEYENVTDASIFLKFKLKDKDDEYLVVWTTTPWTIPYNLAVMVNPEMDYVKSRVQLDGKSEIWITAKSLAGALILGVANKKFEILEEFKGEELEGTKYIHPLYNEIPAFDEIQKTSKKLHTVILSKEYVDASAGSGLVHCAPGCGPEDFEVGKENGLPPFNNLDERGLFVNMGKYENWTAKTDDKKFTEELKEKGSIIETTPVEHEYAHCWRCHNPVIFRATEQWFLKIEDLKEELLKGNQDVHWEPKKCKDQYNLWISNLKDNSISRQRFWGTPVPIWECECGNYIVIGSAEELKQKSTTKRIPEDLHKPWIDEVKIKCDKCSKEMSRVPDIIDVWIDAGTASWNCLDWPINKHLLKEMYPADFILEATEQVRLWFSMLNICSYIALGKQSFKNVYAHGMILDYQGMKMSKSLGNIISPYEVMDKYGADVLRYYMCEVPAGENINFNWDDINIKQRNLMILWNLHKLLIETAELNTINPAKLEEHTLDRMTIKEAYILSKLNSAIKETTELFEQYKLDETQQPIEQLYLELSRTYIQQVRDSLNFGTKEEKELILKVIYDVLLNALKMLAPITPFITEKIYQNLKDAFHLKKESLHLLEWPLSDTKKIDSELETSFVIARDLMQAILHSREKISLGVRWPLLEAFIVSKDEDVRIAAEKLSEVIKQQTNLKEVIVAEKSHEIKTEINYDESAISKEFGADSPGLIKHLHERKPEEIYKRTISDSGCTIKIGKKEFPLEEKHFVVEKKPVDADKFVLSELKNADVLLNKQMTPELEAEGFAREVIRRVQDLRKKAGLQKQDSITLHLKTDVELFSMLKQWEKHIQEKVGASEIKISAEKPVGKFQNDFAEKIKGRELHVMFNKV